MDKKLRILSLSIVIAMVALVFIGFASNNAHAYQLDFRGKIITNTTTTIIVTTSSSVGTTSTIKPNSTYVFNTLIGSVLNGAVLLNSPFNTKTLQGAGAYAFPHTSAIYSFPSASPYTSVGGVPIATLIEPNVNGGGVQFFSFTSGSNDNIMQLTSAQNSGLIRNWGQNLESTYLWLTGFPVFDQGPAGSPVNQFKWMDAGGAYQASFGVPIQNSTYGNVQIYAPINLFNQNWSILNGTSGGVLTNMGNTVAGGHIYLAQVLVPITTVYVGHNLTSKPWTVELVDLGQPNNNGISPASLSIFYNNVLTNTTNTFPPSIVKYTVSGHVLYVNVNQTFAGLYAYQKWARLGLYSTVYKVSNGGLFNQTADPGWYTSLLWTNTTNATTAGKARALQSIILYNTSPTSVSVGQNISFIKNPSAFRVAFLGSTLFSANSFDSVSVVSESFGLVNYQNLGISKITGVKISNITEPAQELFVSSQIPHAFTYSGQNSSNVVYELTLYELNDLSTASGIGVPVLKGNSSARSSVQLLYNGANAAVSSAWVNRVNPLSVSVTGYATATSVSPITQTLTFSSGNITLSLPSNVYNVTAIKLSRALPGPLTITVNGVTTFNAQNSIVLATLVNASAPGIFYVKTGQPYTYAVATNTSVIYNQNNGQSTDGFNISQVAGQAGLGVNQYFTYTITEHPVPSSPTWDQFVIGIDNSTSGVAASPLFQLNWTNSGTRSPGVSDNITYQTATQGNFATISVIAGFTSEKGSKVSTISPTFDGFSLPKAPDMLQFSVTSTNSTTTTITTTSTSTSTSTVTTTIHPKITTFVEQGLPNGGIFRVDYANRIRAVIVPNTTINFSTPSGNYSFYVYAYIQSNRTKFIPHPANGTLAAGSSQNIHFTRNATAFTPSNPGAASQNYTIDNTTLNYSIVQTSSASSGLIQEISNFLSNLFKGA